MIEEIEKRVAAAFAGADVAVTGQGNHFEVRVVAAAFAGLSRVKRQQAVYAALRDLIASGAMHAVTIKALAPSER